MKLKFHVSTNRVGSQVEEIVEVPDNYTEEEIEAEFREFVNQNINECWEKIKNEMP